MLLQGGKPRKSRDQDRDRVVGEDPQVVGIEPGMTIGRDERRVDHPLDVPFGDERGGSDHAQPHQRNDADDHEPMPEPADPVDGDEDRHDREGRCQGGDRDEDVQPKLGPAVGVLVEPESNGGGDEDDPGQTQQAEHRRPGMGGSAGRRWSRGRRRPPPARQAAATSSKKPRRA